MNFVLLTFAVISPMSIVINMSFTRREQSLNSIATIKSTLLNLYGAYCTWDWKKPNQDTNSTGRIACKDITNWFVEYYDPTLSIIYNLSNDLVAFLQLPTNTRSRHKVTYRGIKEAKTIADISNLYYRQLNNYVSQLTTQCEILKKHGLPPNEAIRIRQVSF